MTAIGQDLTKLYLSWRVTIASRLAIARTKPTLSGGTLRLRVLATTDLHCRIWPHDYDSNRAQPGLGLAATATLIHQARAEVDNCLLLDNGDFLQGTALADLYADPRTATQPHPMVAAMNALDYDAGNLGNHDFNYGLPALTAALSGAQFPVICANLVRTLGATAARDTPFVPPYVLLDRRMRATDGSLHDLRIGIIGAAPPQTVMWDATRLEGQIAARGIVAAIAAHLPDLRAAGADLVIALCHSGLGRMDAADGAEDASLALAALDGLDVIIAGHSHRLLPGPSYDGCPGVDARHGRLLEKPAVMAGSFGAHLGLIDLDLTRTPDGWRPVSARSRLRSVADTPQTPDPAVLALTRAAHSATCRATRAGIGETRSRLHTVFALMAASPALAFVASAQIWRARQLLDAAARTDLPILSAVAPFKAGGHAGPDAYTDIPPGPLSIGHMTELSPFPNQICVVEVTGRALRDWLDRASAIFRTVPPGARDAPLLIPDAAGYNFDVIHGLTYNIDLSVPARYSPLQGRLVAPDMPSRIRDLCHLGRRVSDTDRFAVATNTYRAAGGGAFDMATAALPLAAAPESLRDSLSAYVRAASPIAPNSGPVWNFSPLGATAVFEGRATGLPPEDSDPTRRIDLLSPDPTGFGRYRLHL